MTREELFEKRFAGTLSAEEAAELKRLLAEDPEARRAFVRFTEERSILVRLTGRLAAQARVPAAARSARRRGTAPWVFGVAAAAVFVGIVALLSSLSTPPPEPPVRPPSARAADTVRAEREMAAREAEERRAREEMARLEREAQAAQERLAATARERQAVDEARRAEERRRAEEELARLEARRREARAAIEKAEAERKKAEEELARRREEEKKAVPAPGPTVAAVATLASLEGEVTVEGRPAAEGAGVLPGQSVESAGASSRAVLAFADGTRIELAGRTSVRELRESDARRGKGATVLRGAATITAPKQPAGRPLVIGTPHGEARVLGTVFRVAVSEDPAAGTRVEVREGRVRLVRSSDGRGADVSSGQYALAAPGAPPVARPLFVPRIEEGFEAMPAWAGTSRLVWGTPAAWSIGPGQGGSALLGARAGPGSTVQALVYPVPANARIEVSVAMKCPRFADEYWAETGFRVGTHAADDFDVNPKEWTLLKRFESPGGQNGNGNAWTVYSAQAETGTATRLTVGFKLGSKTGPGPTVAWDSLRISY